MIDRCEVCHKVYDECRCSEYAEAQKKREHEMTMRDKLIFSGDKLIEKLKIIIVIAIISGTVGAVIASIANSISNLSGF